MDARELQQRMWDVVQDFWQRHDHEPSELWLSFDEFLAYRDWFRLNEAKYQPPEAWDNIRFCGIRVTHHEDALAYGGIMVSPADAVAVPAR